MSNALITVEERARARARYLTGLWWHAGTYLIIGTVLIVLDLLGPGWLNWSFWILGFWGFGLAFHVLSYFIRGRLLEQQLADQFVLESKHKQNQYNRSKNGVTNA